MRTITFTHINNDGNPRYVCHFLNLNTEAELAALEEVPVKYQQALARARTIGGRKFHNKQYGGGIVFVSYNLEETCKHIARVVGERCKPKLG